MRLKDIARKKSIMNDFEEKAKAAYEALLGQRDDVYPCREDIPAELWGMPIVEKNKE